ncbi:ATP adenylyltransferase-domain-containing protein [Chytriomyces cf. hyalinus JEL632]|nr:ATP adenylyltransferase-domain-containing protein [Chytriomyces cf. hyalinus JEL632]
MTLINRLGTQFDTALAAGHLVFTPSTCVQVHCDGIDFQIRHAPSLALKPQRPKHQNKQRKPFNPFLPPDVNLTVDESLLGTHALLLNKFAVVRAHALVVTKAWASQSSFLDAKDWAAAWALMGQADSQFLGFFNCGPLSGASVPHKHMQFIPVHQGAVDDMIPIENLLESHKNNAKIGSLAETVVDALPFFHRACFIPESVSDFGEIEAAYLGLVKSAFQAIGIDTDASINNDPDALAAMNAAMYSGSKEELSYNLIFTKSWMIVIPRRAETFNGLSVNSVGFAGMLLTKSAEQLEGLQNPGALSSVLAGVAYPKGHMMRL